MASKSPLHKARKLLRAGKYPKVISLLEPLVPEYRESFDFFFLLGTACLYVEDVGGAEAYYKTARRIRPENPAVLKAQGAMYLRLGNVTRALENYLHVLDVAPGDKTANEALEFIRRNSDPEKMDNKIRSGAVRQFYPKKGLNPAVVPVCAVLCILCVGGVFFAKNYKTLLGLNGARADLSYLELTKDEKANSVIGDVSSGNYKYILTTSEATDLYENAKRFFQQRRDNEARRCINKILLSNAVLSIRTKASQLVEYLEEPRFDTITDNYPVKNILEDSKEVYTYQNCWVVWSGRVSNVEEDEKFYKCDFLVGYEDLRNVDATITLAFEQPIQINPEKPIKVLAQISITDEGELFLWGKSFYQPVSGNSL